MRKRIIIGLCAVVVIGVVVFFISGPKRGTVEWHKREYLSARMELQSYRLSDRIRRLCYGIVRKPVPRLTTAEVEALFKKYLMHEQALVKMGFLVRREVRTEAVNPIVLWIHLNRSKEAIGGYAHVRLTDASGAVKTNFLGTDYGPIELTAPTNDLPKWEDFVKTFVSKPRK